MVEDPVTPGRDSHLLGGVVDIAIGVIFVCGIEIQRGFQELAQDVRVRHFSQKLVMLLQEGVVLLDYCFSDNAVF